MFLFKTDVLKNCIYQNAFLKEDFFTEDFLKQTLMLTAAAPTTTTDDDDEGRQTQPCEATAFEQTPIADDGNPYRPHLGDNKPKKNGDTLRR